MTTDPALDDLLAVLPPVDPRQWWEELQQARRRAAEGPPPPPGIPVSEYVYPAEHPLHWRFLAFGCPRRCGWSHVEDLLLNDMEDAARPYVIPAGPPEEISRAISARAGARAEEQRERIEGALREHAETAHSDHEGVGTLGVLPRPPAPAGGPREAPPAYPPPAGPPHWRGHVRGEQ